MPKISVIVPCYNMAEYVGNCIDHLIHQTIGLENLEIILVDDASTDGGRTLSVLMEYEKQYPENILVIPLEENMRQGGARNVGIFYASGEYILFCDADDWIVEEAAEHLYQAAKEYDCDVVEYDAVDVWSVDVEKQPLRDSDKKDELWKIDTIEQRKKYLMLSTDVSSLGCWNKMYRASMVKDNDIRFAEHVAWEEPSFTYIVRLYAKTHYYFHEKLQYYYRHSGSTMLSNYEGKKFDNMVTYKTLLDDVTTRGLMKGYQEELEYLFWHGYFHSGLLFAVQRNIFFNNEEFVSMQQTVQKAISDIRDNRYFKEKFGGFPQLGDIVYCDGARIDMQELQSIYREIYEIIYKPWIEK